MTSGPREAEHRQYQNQIWQLSKNATKSAFRNLERSTEYLRVFCKMKTQSIFDMLAKRTIQAKVKKFRLHDLRRSFVSDLLDANADLL